jgi:hypothetical protein
MSGAPRVGCARLVAGALAGVVLGGALGYGDLLFLGRRIDFERPKNFSGPTGVFVGHLLVGVNACCGLPAGAAAVVLLPRRGRLWARVLPGAVVGGYLGALLGFIDVAFLGPYFNLLDSDLVAVWREDRSLLVILNAAGAAAAGVLASLSTGERSPPETGRKKETARKRGG